MSVDEVEVELTFSMEFLDALEVGSRFGSGRQQSVGFNESGPGSTGQMTLIGSSRGRPQ